LAYNSLRACFRISRALTYPGTVSRRQKTAIRTIMPSIACAGWRLMRLADQVSRNSERATPIAAHSKLRPRLTGCVTAKPTKAPGAEAQRTPNARWARFMDAIPSTARALPVPPHCAISGFAAPVVITFRVNSRDWRVQTYGGSTHRGMARARRTNSSKSGKSA
jgi:hypothetical protein